MTNQPIAGSCLCGEVTFEVTLPFQRFRYCHCRRCRKVTGSAHVANIFAPRSHLQWKTGEAQVRRYDLPHAKGFASSFCLHCGSPVPRLSRDGTKVIIPAGALDGDPGTHPERSIFWSSRAPWYVSVDELPKHAEYPPGE